MARNWILVVTMLLLTHCLVAQPRRGRKGRGKPGKYTGKCKWSEKQGELVFVDSKFARIHDFYQIKDSKDTRNGLNYESSRENNCKKHCCENPKCQSASYNKKTQECKLFRVGGENIKNKVQIKPNYEVKTFTKRGFPEQKKKFYGLPKCYDYADSGLNFWPQTEAMVSRCPRSTRGVGLIIKNEALNGYLALAMERIAGAEMIGSPNVDPGDMWKCAFSKISDNKVIQRECRFKTARTDKTCKGNIKKALLNSCLRRSQNQIHIHMDDEELPAEYAKAFAPMNGKRWRKIELLDRGKPLARLLCGQYAGNANDFEMYYTWLHQPDNIFTVVTELARKVGGLQATPDSETVQSVNMGNEFNTAGPMGQVNVMAAYINGKYLVTAYWGRNYINHEPDRMCNSHHTWVFHPTKYPLGSDKLLTAKDKKLGTWCKIKSGQEFCEYKEIY